AKDCAARSRFSRLLLDRSDFPRRRRSDARILASRVEKRHRVDVQNLLVMAGYCGIGPGLRFRWTNYNPRWRNITSYLRFQGLLARLGYVLGRVEDWRGF